MRPISTLLPPTPPSIGATVTTDYRGATITAVVVSLVCAVAQLDYNGIRVVKPIDSLTVV